MIVRLGDGARISVCRVGVRGFGSIERPKPLTPPLSLWEREQTEFADGNATNASTLVR
jgi:hypothetical protein